MTFKVLISAILVLVGATALCSAQSMPNYGPNAPANADSFGKPPSGTRPPGVSRSARSAYAYRRHHYRHYQHPRPPQD